MTKYDKLIQRIKANPHDVRFAELQLVLFRYGFVRAESRGSHVAFQHPDGRTLIIVKPHGVRKTCLEADVNKVMERLEL